jgi:hypothetical protein
MSELDAQGRLLVPTILRESAQIDGEVDMLGNLTYVELHSHSRILKMMDTPLTEEEEKFLDEVIFGPVGPYQYVEVVDFSAHLLDQLKRKPDDIYILSPDEFERLICDRLQAMGMWVRRVGTINEGDGGIDILAGPERDATFPYLVAVQAKHHRSPKRKSGPSSVRELQAVIQKHPLNAGLLVTNTSFTPSAQWEASHRSHLARLRDVQDLKRWIQGNFLHEAEWREIPDFIEYAPGKRLAIPKFPCRIRRLK